MERLHPPSPKAMAGQASKSYRSISEDAKKRLRLLSSAFVKTTADKEEKTCLSRRSPQGVDGRLRVFCIEIKTKKL